MYPGPENSCKNMYPFRLSTTSYIYPDHIVPNVKILSRYLDEVELLFFESQKHDSLPSSAEIEELSVISSESGVHYNVHLPVDISLSDPDPFKRLKAVEVMNSVINLARKLNPTTYTLHLPFKGYETTGTEIMKWQENVSISLGNLLESSGMQGTCFSVETLDFPFDYLKDIIRDFNLSVCIDLGHNIVHGYDYRTLMTEYGTKVPVIHLHGVDRNSETGRIQDHVSLDRLEKKQMLSIVDILKDYHGVVSLEVFSYENLCTSLKVLEYYFHNIFDTMESDKYTL